MNLYFICAHSNWDISAMDPQYNVDLFVFAYDENQAVDLWCQSFADWGTFVRDKQLPDFPAGEEGKTCLVVRDLSYEERCITEPSPIAWNTIDTIYIQIKEI